jgi:hypothetical protein
VVPQFVIAIATTLQLWLVGGTPAAPASVAQAAEQVGEHARATDRAAARVAAASADLSRATANKNQLARRYEGQLRDIDQLKKGRASWRRDRLIRQHKAASLTTGRQLQELDQRIRAAAKRLLTRRRALVVAVDRELEAGASSRARTSKLRSMRRTAARALHRDKKIVLPDDTIDPLADPEELEYQASRLAQSEKQLTREISVLAERAKRYRHMDKLRKKQARAAEAGRWDDSRSRRTTGRSGDRQNGAGTLAADDADGEAEGPSASPLDDEPNFGGSEYSDPTVVLVDVVDTDTLDALRSAQVSSNLVVKAKAAERAHKQVRSQLERLRKRRQLIEKRAKRLRRR